MEPKAWLFGGDNYFYVQFRYNMLGEMGKTGQEKQVEVRSLCHKNTWSDLSRELSYCWSVCFSQRPKMDVNFITSVIFMAAIIFHLRSSPSCFLFPQIYSKPRCWSSCLLVPQIILHHATDTELKTSSFFCVPFPLAFCKTVPFRTVLSSQFFLLRLSL